jgi:RND family efflux transporter MFP subunit
MTTSIKKITTLFLLLALASCGTEDKSALLKAKQAQLEEAKKQQSKLNDQVASLEAEIAKLDPASAKKDKEKLVTIAAITDQPFSHYIDLQGKVDATNISNVTPRLGPGQVRALYVKKGDVVHKGQLLLKLDDAVIKQQVVAAKQNIETLKSQLAFAKDIYNRQNNLWKQGIGTEVQLLTYKNNVDNLQKQITASEASVQTGQEQLDATNVLADIDGVADDVNVRVGETFAGAAQIRIVNTSDLKVTVQIPENYLGKVHVGSPVKITFPDINKSIDAKVTVASNLIDANSRSFYVEVKVPANKDFRPNQIANVSILDYTVPSTITVPVNTLQTDEKGKFVMVAVKENNKLFAKKKPVTIGELYADRLEIKGGLQVGDQLITDGFQSVYDGQLISTSAQ